MIVTASLRIIIVSFFLIMANASVIASVGALDIIRRADEIRSPNKPFRYTVTVLEYKDGVEKEENKQILDISMRFMKPEKGMPADARSLARFIYPPRDKGNIMLSDWYDLWFYTPSLRRPIPVSREQRLVGQISNGDVIVTNFEYSYSATLAGDKPCGESICYELVLLRKSDAVTYPKIIYLVEKENYHPYQASYYSMDDKLLKTVKYENFQMVLGEMRPMKIVVRDAKHSKGYSVMEYSDARLESLPESNFTREYILRGVK